MSEAATPQPPDLAWFVRIWPHFVQIPEKSKASVANTKGFHPNNILLVL